MSIAAAAENQNNVPAATGEDEVALPLRGDTFLGVFEAIGQDLGFNPNWLRIPFAALILWNPAAIISAYLGLGCIVALSRWLFPVSKPLSTQAPAAPAASDDDAVSVGDRKSEKELLAA